MALSSHGDDVFEFGKGYGWLKCGVPVRKRTNNFVHSVPFGGEHIRQLVTRTKDSLLLGRYAFIQTSAGYGYAQV